MATRALLASRFSLLVRNGDAADRSRWQLRLVLAALATVLLVAISVGVVILPAGFLAGCGRAGRGDSPRAKSPISVSPSPEDAGLGTLWLGVENTKRADVVNLTSSPLRIRDLTASCNCVTISPRSFDLAANEQRAISLTITPSYLSGWPTEVESKKLAVQLLATLDGDADSWPLGILRGEVRRILRVSDTIVHLGNSLVLGQPYPTRKVECLIQTPIVAFTVAEPTGQIELHLNQITDARIELSITPHRSAQPGYIFTEVHGVIDLPSQQAVTVPMLTVTGRINHPVAPSPHEVSWGLQPSNSVVTSRIVLRSLLGRAFHIGSLNTASQSTSVMLEESMEGDSQLLVRQVISGLGPSESRIFVSVTDFDGNSYTITIPLSWRAVEIESVD